MMLVADEKKSTESFQEHYADHYKNSYSHGLEQIYAIQTIDVRTIRPMGSSVQTKQKEIVTVQQTQKIDESPQLEFDLGERYRSWITPFFLKEPVQVLGLSVLAEKILIENKVLDIGTLLTIDTQDFQQMKGMGQGHLDELQRRLEVYVGGRDKNHAYSLDFLSWLRCVVGRDEKKKVKVALESYGLGKYIDVSHSEEIEIKRLTLEARREWVEDALQAIARYDVKIDFQQAINCFIIPWMASRNGIALEREVNERFEKVAVDQSLALPIINFLQAVYYQEQSPYDAYLFAVEKGVFCADSVNAERYRRVIDRVVSYFYKETLIYPLDELVMWVTREFSRQWINLDSHFVERVIRFSPTFRSRKNASGKIVVRLA